MEETCVDCVAAWFVCLCGFVCDLVVGLQRFPMHGLLNQWRNSKKKKWQLFLMFMFFLSLSIKGFLALRTWNWFLYVIGFFGLLFHKFFYVLFYSLYLPSFFSLWKLQSKDLLSSGSWFDYAVSHTLLWEFEFAFAQLCENYKFMMFNICFTYWALL